MVPDVPVKIPDIRNEVYLMRKILIVIDMQNDFIDAALGTKEALSIVDVVKKKILSYPTANIIATMDTHFENYMETQEGKYFPCRTVSRNLTDGRSARRSQTFWPAQRSMRNPHSEAQPWLMILRHCRRRKRSSWSSLDSVQTSA